MRVDSRELPLSAVPLCQLLPCHFGPPRPTLSINLYVKGCLDCTTGAFHMSIPSKSSLLQNEVQILNAKPHIPKIKIRIFQYIVWRSSFNLQWVRVNTVYRAVVYIDMFILNPHHAELIKMKRPLLIIPPTNFVGGGGGGVYYFHVRPSVVWVHPQRWFFS